MLVRRRSLVTSGIVHPASTRLNGAGGLLGRIASPCLVREAPALTSSFGLRPQPPVLESAR